MRKILAFFIIFSMLAAHASAEALETYTLNDGAEFDEGIVKIRNNSADKGVYVNKDYSGKTGVFSVAFDFEIIKNGGILLEAFGAVVYLGDTVTVKDSNDYYNTGISTAGLRRIKLLINNTDADNKVIHLKSFRVGIGESLLPVTPNIPLDIGKNEIRFGALPAKTETDCNLTGIIIEDIVTDKPVKKVTALPDEKAVLAEDFENVDLSSGNFGKLSVVNQGIGTYSIEERKEEGKYLKVTNDDKTRDAFLQLPLNNINDDFTIVFDAVFLNGSGSNAVMFLEDTIPIYLSNKLNAYNGSVNVQAVLNLTANVWRKIKIIVDVENMKYDIYVDNMYIPAVTEYAFKNSRTVFSNLKIGVPKIAATGTFVNAGFDNIKIYNGKYIEIDPKTLPKEVVIPKDISGTALEGKVKKLMQLDIITGYEDNTFRPKSNLSRSEFAALLTRALEINGPLDTEYIYYFSDVNNSDWFYTYVSKMVSLGIFTKTDKLNPENNITLSESIKMLAVAAGLIAESEASGGYPDGYIAAAENIGLLSGVIKDINEDITREDAVNLLYNILPVLGN